MWVQKLIERCCEIYLFNVIESRHWIDFKHRELIFQERKNGLIWSHPLELLMLEYVYEYQLPWARVRVRVRVLTPRVRVRVRVRPKSYSSTSTSSILPTSARKYNSYNRTKALTTRKYNSQNRTIVFCFGNGTSGSITELFCFRTKTFWDNSVIERTIL